MLLTLRYEAHSVTDSLFVRMKGDSTFIWDSYADENCASKFVMTVRVSNDTVYSVRLDTSRAQTECDCVFHFRFTVVGLAAGNYWAVIYRQYPWFRDSISQVGTISFNVPSSPSIGMSYALNQSACNAAFDGMNAEPPPAPSSMIFLQNYPNPFNPSTMICNGLPQKSAVKLIVFNTLGQIMATLQFGEMEPGYHEVRFGGSGLASGVFFYRLQAGSFEKTMKMLMIKWREHYVVPCRV